MNRATDKAAMYAFASIVRYKKKKKERKKTHAWGLSRYCIKECRALLCKHAWEVAAFWGWTAKDGEGDTQVKRLLNPLKGPNAFLLIFFHLLLSDGRRSSLVRDPEWGWRDCYESSMPFSRAPLDACTIVALLLQSEKDWVSRCYLMSSS